MRHGTEVAADRALYLAFVDTLGRLQVEEFVLGPKANPIAHYAFSPTCFGLLQLVHSCGLRMIRKFRSSHSTLPIVMDFEDPQFQRNEFSLHREDDLYEVKFLGGPLDGGNMVTDECPNQDCFVHRLEQRAYCYKYKRISPRKYLAEYDGLFNVQRKSEGTSVHWYRLYLVLLIPAFVATGVVVWLCTGD